MQVPDMQQRAMQRADIPWLATSVAVMLPDTGVATAMAQSTMDRSMIAALATAPATARRLRRRSSTEFQTLTTSPGSAPTGRRRLRVPVGRAVDEQHRVPTPAWNAARRCDLH